LYTKLLARLALAPGSDLNDPVHDGVYPRFNTVLPATKLSPAVTVESSLNFVDPPVVTFNTPGVTLADAVIPKSLHGNGPALWLVIPYVAVSDALVSTVTVCEFAAIARRRKQQAAVRKRTNDPICTPVHPVGDWHPADNRHRRETSRNCNNSAEIKALLFPSAKFRNSPICNNVFHRHR
jgi:hypothetical protein